jgi:hypothetical protein
VKDGLPQSSNTDVDLRKRASVDFIVTTLVISLLFAHEVDAVLQAEWRLLYVLREMPEPLAAQWFVAIHVPLFVLVLGLVYHSALNKQTVSRIAISAFAIVHAGLHFRLRNDPLNLFEPTLSLALIYGAALLAACYLGLKWRSRGK